MDGNRRQKGGNLSKSRNKKAKRLTQCEINGTKNLMIVRKLENGSLEYRKTDNIKANRSFLQSTHKKLHNDPGRLSFSGTNVAKKNKSR